jgi:hypothetical protein
MDRIEQKREEARRLVKDRRGESQVSVVTNDQWL